MAKKKKKTIAEKSISIEESRGFGHVAADSYYRFQMVRIGSMNQIRDLIRRIIEEIPFDVPQAKKENKTFSKKYDDKNLLPLLEKMLKEKKVTKRQYKYLLNLLKNAKEAASLENKYKTAMRHFVFEQPIWIGFLKKIMGIGEVIGTNLISRLGDCKDFKRISSLWRYCGLHPVCPNCTETRVIDGKERKFPVTVGNEGICPKCKAKGVGARRKIGRGVDYSPYMKTLLLGKLVPSLIKQNSPIYRDIYDAEKARQKSRKYPEGELLKRFNGYKKESTEISDGHAHDRACRKVAKIFLQHYWVFARTNSDLPITEPYVKSHMGHEHIITWEKVLKANADAPKRVRKPKKTDSSDGETKAA